jgi:hypothetical protein
MDFDLPVSSSTYEAREQTETSSGRMAGCHGHVSSLQKLCQDSAGSVPELLELRCCNVLIRNGLRRRYIVKAAPNIQTPQRAKHHPETAKSEMNHLLTRRRKKQSVATLALKFNLPVLVIENHRAKLSQNILSNENINALRHHGFHRGF